MYIERERSRFSPDLIGSMLETVDGSQMSCSLTGFQDAMDVFRSESATSSTRTSELLIPTWRHCRFLQKGLHFYAQA
jgi:hypothetical protein